VVKINSNLITDPVIDSSRSSPANDIDPMVDLSGVAIRSRVDTRALPREKEIK